jgi:hypothetical protein
MPVMGKSEAQLWADLVGNSPLTGIPVMEEIVAALTRPLDDAERRPVLAERPSQRMLAPDSEDNLHRLFADNHWTDYLPIVLPTPERVAAMLAGTSRRPDEIVGELRPTSTREAWLFTVEKVAVNAVMAGARPEYLPVILALAASGVTARPSTTTSAAAMCVVNGPIRREIGMNSGIGALGPYNHANAAIGRAYGLLSQNLQGGSLPGQTYLGSQGNGYAYNSLTFAENEERSPWEPFHRQRGFRADESVASLFHGNRQTAFALGLRETHWREHVQYMLRGLEPHDPPTLLLDPVAARQFVERGGFDTKEKLIQWLHDAATLPAKIYWDYQRVQNYIYPRALKGVEPYATRLAAAPDALIPMFRLDQIHIIVVGGETNGYWRMMGCDLRASVAIDPWR